MIDVKPHPHLELGTFVAEVPAAQASPAWLVALLGPAAETPFTVDDTVTAAVRDALRAHGYKPTGRGKPASEYLRRAAAAGQLLSINLVVDASNAVSLASGLPISIVDLDRVTPPLSVAVAPPGASYPFNASGQIIDVAGLPCLFDADGPCANAVKDAQRTKTSAATRQALCLVWGARALGDRTARTTAYYRELLARAAVVTREASASAA